MMEERKKDKKLGQEIHRYLVKKGVETPKVSDKEPDEIMIGYHFRKIMEELGLDLTDDSLKGTPRRYALMFTEDLFTGLNYDNFPRCTAVDNKMKYDEMICEKDIIVSSVCEHHFVIIDGLAKVAYIPNKKVLGLSKMNRIVDFFSRRPQIQERLTEQIFWGLQYVLDTDDIAVRIEAVHYCVKSRGVKDQNSKTITQKLGGAFRDEGFARHEFLTF